MIITAAFWTSLHFQEAPKVHRHHVRVSNVSITEYLCYYVTILSVVFHSNVLHFQTSLDDPKIQLPTCHPVVETSNGFIEELCTSRGIALPSKNFTLRYDTKLGVGMFFTSDMLTFVGWKPPFLRTF